MRAIRWIASAGAFGMLGSVVAVDALSRTSGSEFVYTTVGSRLSFMALVPLCAAIVAGVVIAIRGTPGTQHRRDDIGTLVMLDGSLVFAVLSIVMRDNETFAAHDPVTLTGLVFALGAFLAAATAVVHLFSDRSASVTSPDVAGGQLGP